ncbi:MAG TPA: hypothetical protein PK431_16815 [Chitinophagales bacterium]|nr:hypothetical protein [Chitinophagales bacterium]
MIKLIHIVMIWLSILLINGCNLKNETQNDNSSEKNAMTVIEAKSFLDADEANNGKDVTVTAYSWGYNNRVGGEIQLNLGDEILKGDQQANFSCIFKKEDADKIKAIEKDAKVTVSGKISKGDGGIELNNCRIIQ